MEKKNGLNLMRFSNNSLRCLLNGLKNKYFLGKWKKISCIDVFLFYLNSKIKTHSIFISLIFKANKLKTIITYSNKVR